MIKHADFFIGILGERYGWVPSDSITESLPSQRNGISSVAGKLSRHNHVLTVPFFLEASGDNSTKMEDMTNYIMHLLGQSLDTPVTFGDCNHEVFLLQGLEKYCSTLSPNSRVAIILAHTFDWELRDMIPEKPIFIL